MIVETTGLQFAQNSAGKVSGIASPQGTLTFAFDMFKTGVPIGIAPTGTMGANGAVTLGTALLSTFSAGIWLYYPAGAVSAGSAVGFYWTVMSNTTAGTVYTNTYTPGTDLPTIPASPTAVVDAGPGAFTGVTTSVNAVSISITGGILGINGIINCNSLLSNNNSAGNKSLDTTLGSTSHSGVTVTTTTLARSCQEITNRGRTDRQVSKNYAMAGSVIALTSTASSEDTSANINIIIALRHATNATDWIVLETSAIQVIP